MEITINKEKVDIPDSLTLDELKSLRGIPTGGVAIAVNGKIVLAPEHSVFILNEGDEVIVIGAAYGG